MNISRIKTLIPAPESAFTVDLDNEYSSVPLDAEGYSVGEFNLIVALQAHYGAKDVLSGCSIAITNEDARDHDIEVDTSGFKSQGIKIHITDGTYLADKNEIVFAVTHPDHGTRRVTLTLGSVRAGADGKAAVLYELMPSLSAFSFARTADGGLAPDSRVLTLAVKKTTGTKSEEKTIGDCGLTVRYSTSSMPASKSAGKEFPASLTVYGNDTFTHVYIAAFNADGALVDRETIPVVKDGANGADAVIYYLTASVGTLDADDDGSVTTPDMLVSVRRWKKKGNAAAELTTDGVFKIYTIKGETKVQFGQPELPSEFSFKASMANGCDCIQAELSDDDGNPLCTPLSIPVKWKGEAGKTGNGITSERTYYLATTMAAGVTRGTDVALWTTSYQQATPDKPYVWRYKVTFFRDTAPAYTDCELIFCYSGGANANLLEQTNFSSVHSLDKWDLHSVYINPSVNGYREWATDMQYYLSYYSDRLYGGSWMTDKPAVVPSLRYLWSRRIITYGRVNASGNFVDAGGNEVGAGGTPETYTVMQTPDSGIGIGVDGHGVISTGLQGHNAYQDGTRLTGDSIACKEMLQQLLWENSGACRKLEPDAWYTLSFWAKGSGCTTYIYPSCFDTASPCYVDGILKEAGTTGSDARIGWSFTDVWVRHTFTFKTKADFLNAATGSYDSQYMLFRLPPGGISNVWLCMPKLEVGMQATSYMSSEATLHTGQPRSRRWAMNTEYQSGAPDERYDDTVLLDSKGFYHCIKAHISTEDNKPFHGSKWKTYWEEGARIENLATDFFLAEKAVIKNLIAELIQTGYEGMPHIEAQGSEFRIFSYGKYPIVELTTNEDGVGVLRFLNESTGAIFYDLGPSGIRQTVAQDEKLTFSDKYQMVSDYDDNYDTEMSDAFTYFGNIFNTDRAASKVSQLCTYEAKIVANLYDPGQYCATADDAKAANKRMFTRVASTSASGSKFIRDIPPFTGLLCYSWHSVENGGLQHSRSPYSVTGRYGGEGQIIAPDDYDEDEYGGLEVNFRVGEDGYYEEEVYWRTVIHVTEGVIDGRKTFYCNRSRVS